MNKALPVLLHTLILFTFCLAADKPVNATESALWSTECVGYYTIIIPNRLEYPVVDFSTIYSDKAHWRESSPQFSNTIPSWGTNVEVDIDGSSPKSAAARNIYASSKTTMQKFGALFDDINAERATNRRQILDRFDVSDESSIKRMLVEKAQLQPPVEWLSSGAAFAVVESSRPIENPATPGDSWVNFRAFVGDRIVGAVRRMNEAPQKTVDIFLSHYRPRLPFEIPPGPGVCIPYAFMSGEQSPAKIGVSMRFLNKPDIVVFFEAYDASKFTENPKKFLGDSIEWSYFDAKTVVPLGNRIKVFEKTNIDGEDGLGAFVSVTRDRDAAGPPINNEADHDRDFGYLAYVPGKTGGKPGESFNLILKVERFGRFAEQPMSEKEFRELVAALAAGIHRRPGAWTPH